MTQGIVAGVFLAAGFSRRFGGLDKLNQILPSGERIVMAAANHLIQALPQSIAVLKHQDDALAYDLQRLGFQVVRCAENASSMAESLVTGVLAASELPSQGCLIALADMPFIQPATILKVAAASKPNSIIIPTFQQHRGHPVAFSCEYYQELLKVTGDNGAKVLLERFNENLTLLPCDDAGILQDIDTPEMLAACFAQKT